MIDQTKLEERLIATDTSKKFPELVTLVNHTHGELLKIGTQNLCKNTPMAKYIDALKIGSWTDYWRKTKTIWHQNQNQQQPFNNP